MIEKIFKTRSGDIHYWTNRIKIEARPALVFLPGLASDHRLFDKQIDYFSKVYNVLTWDPPAHGKSYPFEFDYSLAEKAGWLDEILEEEGISDAIIIGQSMGGYVGQAFATIYPSKLRGLIPIDSAQLHGSIANKLETIVLGAISPLSMVYPWNAMVKFGAKRVAFTEFGRMLEQEMMRTYEGDKSRYSQILSYGYKIIVEAMSEISKTEIKCPVLLLCGEKDNAGLCKRFNREWSEEAGFKLKWIENAGHNANADQPEITNKLIEVFLREIGEKDERI